MAERKAMSKKHKNESSKSGKKDKKLKAAENHKSEKKPASQKKENKGKASVEKKTEAAAPVQAVNRDELFRQFASCSELYNLIENSPLSCAGVPLYHAESYMLSLIADIQPVNLTRLAASLGISKSGAAKTANKLILKGLLTKEKSPDNSREVLFKVTPRGEEVIAEIAPATESVFNPVTEMVNGLDEIAAAAVMDFLRDLENVLTECSDRVQAK